MAAPEWVSKQLFENALRDYLGNKEIQILGYTSTAAVPVGDNYTSDLFRTTITYTPDHNANQATMSVIVKCMPESRAGIFELVKEIHLFEKEAEMFTKTLPALYKILGEEWTLSSKLIYFTNEPHTIIIFEDLSLLGFKMYDRRQGLDLDHCLMVIEKMAMLHAASVILYEKDPKAFANYGEGLFSENKHIVEWISIGVDSIAKACKTWKGYEKYGAKLAAIRNKIVKKGIAAAKRKLGGFNVLNHGDTWVNNFMFSYDEEEKLKDFKFVDYQLVIYTSPAIDLQYFWATSPKIEVRREHLDTILDRYYAQLLLTLTKLQYPLDKVPTRKQFREDWESKAIYGFIGAATVLPLVKASSREDASFEDILARDDENSFRYHAYNNERFRKHIQFLLPFFDHLGALNE